MRITIAEVAGVREAVIALGLAQLAREMGVDVGGAPETGTVILAATPAVALPPPLRKSASTPSARAERPRL